MVISLAQKLKPLSETSGERFIARVTAQSDLAPAERAHSALLVPEGAEKIARLHGFRAYLCSSPLENAPRDSYLLPKELRHLGEGDVVRIEPARRALRVLFRPSSPSNAFLVTERCDNFCVMCSQPPRDVDDGWLVDELLTLFPLIPKSTAALGVTGGEPGLLGTRLVDLVAALSRELPQTALHILSNGRAFSRRELAASVGAVAHRDLMIGIPVYSDVAHEHDYVVQAKGAFDETIRGILNLKASRVRVELRVVIHQETARRLPELARFIARNLVFVDHVALMGLELMGFARTNLDALWLDPLDYADELAKATETLHRARVPVSIYNHQLCVLPAVLHPFARKSISDWKNMYAKECDSCAARQSCGGFFASSSLRKSRGIAPLSALNGAR